MTDFLVTAQGDLTRLGVGLLCNGGAWISQGRLDFILEAAENSGELTITAADGSWEIFDGDRKIADIKRESC